MNAQALQLSLLLGLALRALFALLDGLLVLWAVLMLAQSFKSFSKASAFKTEGSRRRAKRNCLLPPA